MSQSFREKTTQDNRAQGKCRIPQRIGSGKHRPLSKGKELRQTTPNSENGRKVETENIIHQNENVLTSVSVCPETTVTTVSKQKIPSDNSVNVVNFSEGKLNAFDITNIQTDDPIELKEGWIVKRNQFEAMRNDLNERQGAIMEVYAALKATEEKLALLGHKTSSSVVGDDLRVMNVARMTPQQLLQLCGEAKACRGDIPGKEDLAATYFNIDMKTMYNLPSKVFETCEEALKRSKEFIHWLENLKENHQDLSHSKNTRKINDFKAECDTLYNKVQAVKTELSRDLNEITDVIRKCVNETIAVSLRNEDLTHELSRLNTRTTLLQKQIKDKDHAFKLHPNKTKIEELEKKFKEEKLKNVTALVRLKKIENESQMNETRAIRLEVALDQARAQNRVSERTVQIQRDQNQQSQKEFNDELCKLTDSIKENSKNLEKLAEAKIKLQNEKEELVERLNNISDACDKTINNLEIENTRRVVKMEKMYKEELDEKINLQTTVQTLQSQLVNNDNRLIETQKLLHETEAKLSDALNDRGNTAEVVKLVEDLEGTRKEIDMLNKNIMEQNKLIEEMQAKLNAGKTLDIQLQNEINVKTRHIEDQQKKYMSLESEKKESDLKMHFYEKQLMDLKEHIKTFKDKYGENKNLNESNITKIQELNQRNDELTRALQNQAMDLKACMHTVSAQEEHIKEREALFSKLYEKEKEQTNTVEFLQKSLASKVNNKRDHEVKGKLIQQDSEIKSLIIDIGTKEKRISQMEKIMIALYDRARKTKSKNKRYQEKIKVLKQVISEYETYIDNMNVDPSENLDSLIRILENEMETALCLPSDKHFETAIVNKKRKLIRSEGIPSGMPYIIIQRDHSSSCGGPLPDRSGQGRHASDILVQYSNNHSVYPDTSVSTAKHRKFHS